MPNLKKRIMPCFQLGGLWRWAFVLGGIRAEMGAGSGPPSNTLTIVIAYCDGPEPEHLCKFIATSPNSECLWLEGGVCAMSVVEKFVKALNMEKYFSCDMVSKHVFNATVSCALSLLLNGLLIVRLI